MTLVAPARAADQVTIDSGVVQGRSGTRPGVRVFEGIPYAAPPVGDLRWRAPEPVAPWPGVRMATKFGPRPMQGSLYSDMEFRDEAPSEDCLYLNVWTPARSPSERLPVMVWIYGGAFETGSTSEHRQDGVGLAAKGVVVVSMNYRVGVFGFFSHPDLSRESGHASSGDYGIMDQIAALKWVQRNIAAFGGDPGNVTIFGESAGSYSVSILMASPLARGLFVKAIGESGSLVGTARIPHPLVKTLASEEKNGARFAQTMGATTIAMLRAKPANEVLKAALGDKLLKIVVVVDGYVMPRDLYTAYSSGSEARIPLLAGWNADESRAYVTFGRIPITADGFQKAVRSEYGPLADEILKYYPAGSDAEALRSAGDLACDLFIANSAWGWIDFHRRTGAPVYRYQFDHAVPIHAGSTINGHPVTGADVGAPHSAEIPYVFGALDLNTNVAWQPDDWKVSAIMQAYWVNFARTGNPNGDGVPIWPRFTEQGHFQVMHLDAVPKLMPEAYRARHAFWDAVPPKSTNETHIEAGS